jgi:hypothetical protein
MFLKPDAIFVPRSTAIPLSMLNISRKFRVGGARKDLALLAKSEIRLAVLCYFQAEPLRSQAEKLCVRTSEVCDELLSLNYHSRV